MKVFVIYVFIILSVHSILNAQKYPKIEILRTSEKTATGYYFLGTSESRLSIIDIYGNFLKKEELKPYQNGSCFTRQSNGLYTYFDFNTNRWYILDKNLNLIDSAWSAEGKMTDFHDMIILPNMNYLTLGADLRSVDVSQELGIENYQTTVIGFEIQEQNYATKQIEWKWNTFDHIPISNATDENLIPGSVLMYIHTNSFIVDNDGNYIICSRHTDELTKINKNSGEIIWRMGGSKSKANQFTFVNDTNNYGFFGFSHQHDPVRLPNGNLLLFDNGNLKVPQYSRAVEYQIDEVNKKVTKVWEYAREDSLYAYAKGNAQRLANGNTLIHWNDLVTEVSPNGEVVHEFRILDDITTYRVYKYEEFLDFVELSVKNNNTYQFKNSTHNTNVNLQISYLSNNGNLLVEKHSYPHSNIVVDSGNVDNDVLPFRYLIKSKNIDSINAKVTIKLSDLPQYSAGDSLVVIYRKSETLGKFQKIPSFVNSTLSQLEFNIKNKAEIMIVKYGVLDVPLQSYPNHNQFGLSPTVTIKWNAVKNAASYRLILENIVTQKTVLDTIVKTAFLNVYNLTFNTQYRWKVLSQNVGAVSNFSPYRIFQVRIKSPELISPKNGLTNFNVKSDSLNWNAIAGAEFYNVEISNTIDFSGTVFKHYNINKLHLLPNNLLYGTEYFWRVSAGDSKSTSDWSSIFSFMTIERDPALYLPISNSVLPVSKNQLIWKQKNLKDLYSIEVSYELDFKNIFYSKKNIDTNFVDIPDLPYAKSFYWRVRIESELKESEWSNTWIFHTELQEPRLSFPKNDDILSSKSVKLSWISNIPAPYYKLEISLDKNFNQVFVSYDSIISEEQVVNILENNTKYYWRVKAFSSISYSKYSNVYSFNTISEQYLSEPELLEPVSNSEIFSQFIAFKWESKNEDNPNLKFTFQLSKYEDFEEIMIDTLVNKNVFVSPYALDFNEQYFWRVKSNENSVYSSWSVVWSLTVKENAEVNLPQLIFPINETTIDTNYVEFVWSKSNYDGNYFFEISKDYNFTDIIESKELTSMKYLFTNLSPEQKYYWRVSFIQDNANVWSDIAEFITSDFGISSVEEVDSKNWIFDVEKGLIKYTGNEQIIVKKVINILGMNFPFEYNKYNNEISIPNVKQSTIFVIFEMNKQVKYLKLIK